MPAWVTKTEEHSTVEKATIFFVRQVKDNGFIFKMPIMRITATGYLINPHQQMEHIFLNEEAVMNSLFIN
jgi:hypothetical protein